MIGATPDKDCIPAKNEGYRDMSYRAPIGPEKTATMYPVETTHLGIPKTDVTPSLYDEYYVDAGKPVLLSLSFPTYHGGCTLTFGTFVPEAGKDYEVVGNVQSGGFFKNGYCMANVYEVVKGDGDALASRHPVAISRPRICDSDD